MKKLYIKPICLIDIYFYKLFLANLMSFLSYNPTAAHLLYLDPLIDVVSLFFNCNVISVFYLLSNVINAIKTIIVIL